MDGLFEELGWAVTWIIRFLLILGIGTTVTILVGMCLVMLRQNEGVIIEHLGEVQKVRICRRGYHLEGEEIVKNEPGFNLKTFLMSLVGGVRWKGIPGIKTLFARDFRWTKFVKNTLEEREQKSVKRFKLDRYPYGIELKEVESSQGNGVSGIFHFMGEAVNLVKQWVDTVDWFSEITGRLLEEAEGLFGEIETKEIVRLQGKLGKELYDRMKASGALDAIEDELGVRISGFKFVNLDASESVKNEMDAAFQGQQRAKKTGTLMMGVFQAIADATNQPLADVQAEYKRDPKKFAETHATLMGIGETGARTELDEKAVRVTGGSGDATTGLAAHALIAGGGSGGSGGGKSGGGKKGL